MKRLFSLLATVVGTIILTGCAVYADDGYATAGTYYRSPGVVVYDTPNVYYGGYPNHGWNRPYYRPIPPPPRPGFGYGRPNPPGFIVNGGRPTGSTPSMPARPPHNARPDRPIGSTPSVPSNGGNGGGHGGQGGRPSFSNR